MSGQQWVITVSKEHLHRLDEVVEELKSAGLDPERVLRSLGQVTGRTEVTSDPGSSPQQVLAQVSGVQSVAAAQQFRVPPPDSEIQ